MHHGWGRHLWDVSLANLVEFNKARHSLFLSSNLH